MTPVWPRRAIRFGMAMRPLTISASAAFAVVVPSEDGGEGEECERYGEKNRREAAIGDGKCVLCKFSAVGVTEPLAGYDDGKTGQGTNDDGVDEGTGHGNEALFCRPFCFSGSSDDRCGA